MAKQLKQAKMITETGELEDVIIGANADIYGNHQMQMGEHTYAFGDNSIAHGYKCLTGFNFNEITIDESLTDIWSYRYSSAPSSDQITLSHIIWIEKKDNNTYTYREYGTGRPNDNNSIFISGTNAIPILLSLGDELKLEFDSCYRGDDLIERYGYIEIKKDNENRWNFSINFPNITDEERVYFGVVGVKWKSFHFISLPPDLISKQSVYNHAEGANTTASGNFSHAEGMGTIASGDFSHAEGYNTIALGNGQHVAGRYNEPNKEDLFQIGGGSSESYRRNSFYVNSVGQVYIKLSNGSDKNEFITFINVAKPDAEHKTLSFEILDRDTGEVHGYAIPLL